jgi:DNA modification methylase
MTVTILTGDARDVLATLPAGGIDLTVTSPPYDGLRTYNGYSFDFETIAAELFRVTKPGGVVVWVVGDATVKGSETGTSFRQALHFKDVCGFNLHDTMIYSKGAAGGAKGSYRTYGQSFEYMFVLSKGVPNSINLIKDRKNKWGGTRASYGGRREDGSLRRANRMSVAEVGRRLNVWDIPSGFMKSTPDKTAYQHPAIFPEQLAADHIASWSNPGDTVLDPFLGSGTTGKMAALAGRKFIGIEISPEYAELARERLGLAAIPQLEAAD